MEIPWPLREAANADHSFFLIMLLLSEGLAEEGRQFIAKPCSLSPPIPSEIKYHSITPFVSGPGVAESSGIDPRSLEIFSGASDSSMCPGVDSASKT